MQRIPPDITDIIKNNDIEKVVFKDEEFVLVIDPYQTENSVHYCAWSVKQKRDLLDLTSKDIPILERLIEKTFDKLGMDNENYKVFIHFPPSWWHLHIHFISNNHRLRSPSEDIYYLKDIIKNLKENNNYYRERVTIK